MGQLLTVAISRGRQMVIIVEIFEPAASRIVNLSGATILADIFAGITRVAILVTLSVFITTPARMIHALINIRIRLLLNERLT